MSEPARSSRPFREAATFTLSPVLHGEQAALMVCGQLVNVVPDLDGKFAAAVQVMDEARHVEVFARYLDKVGRRYPIDPDLQAIVTQILAETDWEAKCVGMQVILESVALGFFRSGTEMAREPVLASFIHAVHEDEARHVAYGVLSLEERIPNLPEPARRKLEDLAYESVLRIAGRGGRPSFATQFHALGAAGVDVASFVPKLLAELSDPAGLDLDGMEDPVTRTVLPNLIRVGLVPERLLLGYLAQGWRIDSRSGAIEDLHTWHADTRAARAELAARGRTERHVAAEKGQSTSIVRRAVARTLLRERPGLRGFTSLLADTDGRHAACSGNGGVLGSREGIVHARSRLPNVGILGVLAATCLAATPASALSLGFYCITNNLAGDCAIGEAQMSVDVTDIGGGQVSFLFSNAGPSASSITDIYFDDGTLLGIASVNSGPGTDFAQGASPPNLPGADNVSPPFQVTAGFLADSDPPVQPNGANPGEWVEIIFDLDGGGTFADVIDELTTGELRIGIRVQGYASGGSESLINVPVPEAGTIGLLGAGLAALAARRRA